jgi:hypothetical protein
MTSPDFRQTILVAMSHPSLNFKSGFFDALPNESYCLQALGIKICGIGWKFSNKIRQNALERNYSCDRS